MFRIRKTAAGYLVEVQKRKWWGKLYWTHYCHVWGMPDEPWYFLTLEHAWGGLHDKVTSDTFFNSRDCL